MQITASMHDPLPTALWVAACGSLCVAWLVAARGATAERPPRVVRGLAWGAIAACLSGLLAAIISDHKSPLAPVAAMFCAAVLPFGVAALHPKARIAVLVCAASCVLSASSSVWRGRSYEDPLFAGFFALLALGVLAAGIGGVWVRERAAVRDAGEAGVSEPTRIGPVTTRAERVGWVVAAFSGVLWVAGWLPLLDTRGMRFEPEVWWHLALLVPLALLGTWSPGIRRSTVGRGGLVVAGLTLFPTTVCVAWMLDGFETAPQGVRELPWAAGRTVWVVAWALQVAANGLVWLGRREPVGLATGGAVAAAVGLYVGVVGAEWRANTALLAQARARVTLPDAVQRSIPVPPVVRLILVDDTVYIDETAHRRWSEQYDFRDALQTPVQTVELRPPSFSERRLFGEDAAHWSRLDRSIPGFTFHRETVAVALDAGAPAARALAFERNLARDVRFELQGTDGPRLLDVPLYLPDSVLDRPTPLWLEHTPSGWVLCGHDRSGARHFRICDGCLPDVLADARRHWPAERLLVVEPGLDASWGEVVGLLDRAGDLEGLEVFVGQRRGLGEGAGCPEAAVVDAVHQLHDGEPALHARLAAEPDLELEVAFSLQPIPHTTAGKRGSSDGISTQQSLAGVPEPAPNTRIRGRSAGTGPLDRQEIRPPPQGTSPLDAASQRLQQLIEDAPDAWVRDRPVVWAASGPLRQCWLDHGGPGTRSQVFQILLTRMENVAHWSARPERVTLEQGSGDPELDRCAVSALESTELPTGGTVPLRVQADYTWRTR